MTLSLSAAAEEKQNFLGMKASNISGYGIYYARTFMDNYRIKGIGFSYYFQSDKNNDSRTIFNYDAGLELQRFIHRSGNMRVYILAGAYYYSDTDTEKTPENENKSVTDSYNTGVGIGVELIRGRATFSFETGYKYYKDDIDIYTDGKLTGFERKRTTKLGGGISIGFMF